MCLHSQIFDWENTTCLHFNKSSKYFYEYVDIDKIGVDIVVTINYSLSALEEHDYLINKIKTYSIMVDVLLIGSNRVTRCFIQIKMNVNLFIPKLLSNKISS